MRRDGADLAPGVCPHKGFGWARIRVPGRAAHGSRPDLGFDAIAGTGRVLDAIGELNDKLAAHPHPLLGAASVHASTISGGQELSSYPSVCTLELERRTVPGETTEDLERELAELRQRALTAPGEQACSEMLLVRAPFAVDPNEVVVRQLEATATEVLGAPVELVGHSGWMDASFFSAAGIPTVIFGPSGDGADALTEYVELDSVVTCARIISEAASRFCS